MTSSDYISAQRKGYAFYILQSRAIPAMSDGIKTGGRRAVWVARDGNKVKSASLAGAAMPLHPHSLLEGTINTLTAPYKNNIPLFKGYGSFGTLLSPSDYGAGRYTAVALSEFTKDVIMVDLPLVEMIDNYDHTLKEPKHFLPLVPVSLVNFSEGIVIGFSTYILPRNLVDIINAQLQVLEGKEITQQLLPYFAPTKNRATQAGDTPSNVFYFYGDFEQLSPTKIKITSIPYGVSHQDVTQTLTKLEDDDVIASVVDNSRDTYDIVVKFSSVSRIQGLTKLNILKMLGLVAKHTEHIVTLSIDGLRAEEHNAAEHIAAFTKWRLSLYSKRYQYLRDELKKERQRYLDIKMAIDAELGAHSPKEENRKTLIARAAALGIVNTEFIADLPLYRFTSTEYDKNEKKLAGADKLIKEYEEIIQSDTKLRKAYVSDLKTILNNYTSGKYDTFTS